MYGWHIRIEFYDQLTKYIKKKLPYMPNNPKLTAVAYIIALT